MSKFPFATMPLSKDVLKSIEEMGFEEATAIQGEAIPLIMEGKDVIGQSRTGTGKTIAFAVPAVEKADPKKHGIQALILCPTRELCIQVAEEVAKLGRHKKGLFALPIYGGQSYDRQLMGLKRGPQIVIGTPGRLIDLMNRGALKLDMATMAILDEADEMLDMGFQEDLEKILGTMPKERQTILFSATVPNSIRHLAKKYLRDPVMVKASHESLAVPAIEQSYMEVRNNLKLEVLCRVLDLHRVKLGIVFRNTRIGVDELVSQLQARGYSSEGLHGDIKQALRDRIMAKFRGGQAEILVATDVASRGIDVKDVELVVNFDLPKDEEDYIHRIGRTGRAGKAGRAISLVSGREVFKLREIERFTKAKIARLPVPSLDEVEAVQHSELLDKVRKLMKEGGLEKYAGLVERLEEEEFSALDVACALLKISLPETSDRGRDIETGGSGGGVAALFTGGVPVKLFLNVGRIQGAKPKDILGALTGETGLPGRAFGTIGVHPKHTLVEVPAEKADEIIAKMQKAKIKGVPTKARRAEY